MKRYAYILKIAVLSCVSSVLLAGSAWALDEYAPDRIMRDIRLVDKDIKRLSINYHRDYKHAYNTLKRNPELKSQFALPVKDMKSKFDHILSDYKPQRAPWHQFQTFVYHKLDRHDPDQLIDFLAYAKDVRDQLRLVSSDFRTMKDHLKAERFANTYTKPHYKHLAKVNFGISYGSGYGKHYYKRGYYGPYHYGHPPRYYRHYYYGPYYRHYYRPHYKYRKHHRYYYPRSGVHFHWKL